MRYLLGYHWYKYPRSVGAWNEAWLSRLRSQGIDVEGMPLTINPPGSRLHWPDLDHRWRRGDPELLKLYDQIARRLDEGKYDAFINYDGINLHPEFVSMLPAFNVYACFDDPESSEGLSKPVAAAYDLCMIGNIAEVETYKRWGCNAVEFWPLGFRETDHDPGLTTERILSGERDVNLTILCERTTPYRRERLDKIANAFPKGHFYGQGWKSGFLGDDMQMPLYQRTKIGINIHNSTGPINARTYALPANGVMQICDCKSHLGEIFELGREVAGYDTVEEAIDLCRYYLSHEEERRAIAAAGFDRSCRDYSEAAVFQRLERSVALQIHGKSGKLVEPSISIILASHSQKTRPQRILHALVAPARFAKTTIKTLRRALKLRTRLKCAFACFKSSGSNSRTL